MHVASFTLYAFVYNNKELLQSQQYKRKDNWLQQNITFLENQNTWEMRGRHNEMPL
jgi:hypothetical protein